MRLASFAFGSWSLALAIPFLNLAVLSARAADVTKASGESLVALQIKLPEPAFAGTPKDAPQGIDVEAIPTNRPPLMVPADIRNVAPSAKITSSDKGVTSSALARIIDGRKEATEDGAALLRKGLQWIQFDLGAPNEIFAVALWHAHDNPKIYRSVIVQTSDDPDFARGVRTLFNNDRDNSSGLGVGADRQYFETYLGKIIDARGCRARYLRLYSHGSTDSALNEYTEVEIYARPVK